MRDNVRDVMRDFSFLKNSVFTAFAKRVGLWDIFPAYMPLFYINIRVFQKVFRRRENVRICPTVPQRHINPIDTAFVIRDSRPTVCHTSHRKEKGIEYKIKGLSGRMY